jgi:CheY-like chemotaxis protein
LVKVPRILIVDDQPNVRKALRWYFQELKLECSEAENGLDALQKAQQVKPDLIILDFSMPVMNGVEAARVFQQVMPEVPILMLTAHFGIADEAAKDVGVLGVFSKDNIAPLVKQTRTILKMREL